jgi:preprotein translocase subunit YajC
MDMMDQLNAFWPIILMVVIFYFLLWRPQKKQQKHRQEMLDSLKAGAKVVTAGGLIGTIISLHQDYLVVRIADKVEVQVTRSAVTQVLGKSDKAEEKKARKAEKKAEAEAKAEVQAAKEAEAAEAAKHAEPANEAVSAEEAVPAAQTADIRQEK